MTESPTVRVWIRLVKVLGMLGLLVWFSFITLFLHYDATRPTMRQPADGRVYASMNHGHIVYLTREEQFRLDSLERVSIGFFLVFASMGLWARRRQRETRGQL